MANKAAVGQDKAEKRAPSKFVVMQRIDRLLKGLSGQERKGVLAWLYQEYGPVSGLVQSQLPYGE